MKNKYQTLRARVDADLATQVSSVARRFGLSESDIVRFAVKYYLASQVGPDNLVLRPVVADEQLEQSLAGVEAARPTLDRMAQAGREKRSAHSSSKAR